MSVTEAWMGTGSWALRLKPETPGTVIDALDWTKTTAAGLGHVLVFPGRVDAAALTAADVLARAKFTGVLLEWQDGLTVGGAGPGWWLGDSDDKGPIIESAITNTGGSVATWLASLTPPALNTGGIAGAGAAVTATFQWVSYRRAVEAICAQQAASSIPGCGWWVTPDLKLNIGGPTDVAAFGSTSPLVMRRFAGRDAALLAVDVRQLDRAMDLREYVSKVRASGPAGLGTYSAASGYKDINGNTVSIIAMVDVPTCPPGSENGAAQAEYNARNATRRAIRLSSDTYDLGAVVSSQLLTGSYVNVFDPELGLYDPTNEVYFQGMTVWPLKQQVLAQTWPIRNGYGVWFRANDGTYTDLSDWFVPEEGSASIDIGAPPRTLANPSGLQGTVDVKQVDAAVENGRWTAYTPTLRQNATGVAVTVNRARYRREGSTVHFYAHVTTTAVGPSNTTIDLSLPLTAADTGTPVGSFWLSRAGANYIGDAYLQSTTVVAGYTHAGTGPIGVNGPAIRLAVGDEIRVRGTYEAAI